MFKFSIAFLLGVIILAMFSALPHWYWSFGIVPAVLIALKYPQSKLLITFLIGFTCALAHAHLQIHPDLDKSLEGIDLQVSGIVVSIPTQQSRGLRFEFVIHEGYRSGELVHLPKKVRLNWYGNVPVVQLGEIWQITIRLKRPWGFANPGSFDYEKWLFEHEIRATGYVRSKGSNERIKRTSLSNPVHYLRAKLNQKLEAFKNSNSATIKALVLGERSNMDSDKWQVLTQTGTNHLLAISGLHVGIVSGFIYFLVVWCWRRSEKCCLYIPAQRIAAIVAIFAAVFYAMLAGFSIPTQRAMIMATIVFLSIYTMQSFRAWNILAIALLSILVWDPFSVLAPGFWLSFFAVAIILFSARNNISSEKWGFGIIKIQLVLALGLLPITLLFFQQASLIAPLANIFAVPWVSFLVVPLSLVGSLLLFINENLGAWILQLVDIFLKIFWYVLYYLQGLPFASWRHAVPNWALIPAAFGILLLLMPKGWPAKALSIALLSPLVFAKSPVASENDLIVSVLDVGQGSALVLQVGEKVLVYDTGPKFSESFNAGEAIVATYLRKRGISGLDVLIVSHGDKDHAGGLEGLLTNINVKQLITNQTTGYQHDQLSACRTGMQWQWQKVKFSFLHPSKDLEDDTIGKFSKNNSSCVLRVDHSVGSLLLTGDIERPIENKLVKHEVSKLDVDVLIAPHHGSNSSSTADFIRATSPDYVVFTTGYRNPYGFPDEKVVSRYKKFGSNLVNSATQGMITFVFSDKNGLQLQPGYREVRQRFWHTRP